MTEYKGFQYSQYKNGEWILRLPSGFKSIVKAADEDAMRKQIDDLAERFKVAS